ncbi:hypothetical protein V8C44DRAFT_314310 [Trichoderma aethiopicum]
MAAGVFCLPSGGGRLAVEDKRARQAKAASAGAGASLKELYRANAGTASAVLLTHSRKSMNIYFVDAKSWHRPLQATEGNAHRKPRPNPTLRRLLYSFSEHGLAPASTEYADKLSKDEDQTSSKGLAILSVSSLQGCRHTYQSRDGDIRPDGKRGKGGGQSGRARAKRVASRVGWTLDYPRNSSIIHVRSRTDAASEPLGTRPLMSLDPSICLLSVPSSSVSGGWFLSGPPLVFRVLVLAVLSLIVVTLQQLIEQGPRSRRQSKRCMPTRVKPV